jgi:hypothetical protein
MVANTRKNHFPVDEIVTIIFFSVGSSLLAVYAYINFSPQAYSNNQYNI